MSLHLFYVDAVADINGSLNLDEETSKHIVQVLRMKEGDLIELTDGKGNLHTVAIEKALRKKCQVRIKSSDYIPPDTNKIAIAISLLKNSGRFEWFLEKATEIGVNEIIPMICARTERLHFRHDRMNSILVSAILQSRQSWLPDLSAPIAFDKLMKNYLGTAAKYDNRFIAHCTEEKKKSLSSVDFSPSSHSIILIGPEGDFTKEEIELSRINNFISVSLGETRLRTETAGIVALTLIKYAKASPIL